MKEFDEHLVQALKLCEDYTTITPESNTVDMIYFTPQQLKKYTQYCISQAKKIITDKKKQTTCQ